MMKLSQVAIAGLAVALTVSACTPRAPSPPPPVVNRGTPTSPTNPPTGLTNQVVQPQNDLGVITYDGYQSVVARDGDTVTTVAERIGLSASALGSYNGLQPGHVLRPGDELSLPPRPGGYGAGAASLSAPVTAPPVRAEAQPPTIPTPPQSTIEQRPLDSQQATTQQEPATGTGWSPSVAIAAIDRATGLNDDGTLAAPPSAGEPVPPEPKPARELSSPDLGQYQTEAATAPQPRPATEIPPASVEQEVATASPAPPTPPATGDLRLTRPVQGPVAIGFNRGAGPAKNDGVDFAAPAGAPVVAAADGEVALVSQSLGGLGTIVLVRHPNDYLTVYGRVDQVSVSKGDIVSAGQPIGVVSDAAAPAEPRMHFEVRRGAESLDPMTFL